MAIEVGQEAPDFTLRNQHGEKIALSSFRGSKHVVLAFYPLAFSRVCTTQFTRFGEVEARYEGEDAQVIGVSVDSRYAQAAFAESIGLGRTMLLADFEPKGAIARVYGAYLDDFGFSTRATFVIDKSGIVRSAEVMTSPADLPSEEASFAALRSGDA